MDLTQIHLTVISYSVFCIIIFLSKESRIAQWRAPGLTVKKEKNKPQIYFWVFGQCCSSPGPTKQVSQFPSEKTDRATDTTHVVLSGRGSGWGKTNRLKPVKKSVWD